jgi:acylaminoacyl-peptidase
MLGLMDRRVPPSQGLEWFHALRSAGSSGQPPSEQVLLLHTYENDTHGLESAATEADCSVAVARWLRKHLPVQGAAAGSAAGSAAASAQP